MGTAGRFLRVAFLACAAALALALLGACGAQSGAGSSASATAPTAGSTAGAAVYSDPFAYCAAVKTIDTPDARYSGPKAPDAVIAGLQVAMQLPTGTPPPPLVQGLYWRCMDGNVYACTVGANLPCTDKANTDKTPTKEMNDFCASNANADVIPMSVTGHNTVYDWHCNGTTAEVVKQLVTPDAQGYLSNIWYEIKPSQ